MFSSIKPAFIVISTDTATASLGIVYIIEKFPTYVLYCGHYEFKKNKIIKYQEIHPNQNKGTM